MTRCFRSPLVSFVLAVVVFLLAACGGGSESTLPGEPDIAPVATSTAVEAEPSATSVPAVTDQQRIDAALAELEANPEANQDLVAYDVLETMVDEDGNVTVRICGWTGESVFESVFDALFRTTVEADGSVSADNWQTPFGPGDCINSELVNSAFDTINQYEDYWTEITADPSLFATDPRGRELLTDRQYDVSQSSTENWVADDVYLLGTTLSSAVPTDVVAEVVWRRVANGDGASIVEMVFCHAMDESYGIYRDDVLLTDSRGEDDPGLHALDSYTLEADSDSTNGWRIDRSDGIAWSDCFFAGEWVDGANIWREGNTPLVVLPGYGP